MNKLFINKLLINKYQPKYLEDFEFNNNWSIASTLILWIFILFKKTKNKIKIICKKNLRAGELSFFVSDKIPSEKTKVIKIKLINSLLK